MLALILSLGAALGPAPASLPQGPKETSTPAQGGEEDPKAIPDLGDLLDQLPNPEQKPLLAIDGKPVAPGRMPEGTQPEAIALWSLMLDWSGKANRAQQDPESAPRKLAAIKSFDLTFEATIRPQDSSAGTASNDGIVRFQFKDEKRGYLRATLEKSNRVSMRGPKGDWLFDGKAWVALQGREDIESRRELDRWVAIARNFIALTRPASIRLVELKALTPLPPAPIKEEPAEEGAAEAAPKHSTFGAVIEFGQGRFLSLPKSVDPKTKVDWVAQARSLRWLEVTSPDFRLFDTGDQKLKGTPMYRALLGLDAEGRIVMAQLAEDFGGAVRISKAVFVYIPRWVTLGSGYSLPKQLETYRPYADRPGFEPNADMVLFLKTRRAHVNPTHPDTALTEKTFLPE